MVGMVPAPGPGGPGAHASASRENGLEWKTTVPFPWASPIPDGWKSYSPAFLSHLSCTADLPTKSVPARGLAARELTAFEFISCIGVKVQGNSTQDGFLSLRNSNSQIGAT